MAHHIVHLLAFAVAVLLTARWVPGIRVKSFTSAVIFSLVFAILDKLLFSALVLLTFPLVLLSFGLFLIIINAFLFWLADKIVKNVEVDGFGAALVGSIVTSVINWGITWLLHIR